MTDFLVSSLPAMRFGAPPPMTADDFCAKCATDMGAEDCAALAAMVGGKLSTATALARRWNDLATQLRNVLATCRAKGKPFKPHPAEGCELFWQNQIAQAYAENDVMKRDEALDRVMWNAAGELESALSPLGLGAIYAYAVRLCIAIRRAKISTAEGNDVFTQICSTAEPLSL